MELQLKDGRTLTGTPEEISWFIINKPYEIELETGPYGTKELYKSESKGLVPISSMNIKHAQNAMCKIYKGWVEQLNKLDPGKFLDELTDGITDETFIALTEHIFSELEKCESTKYTDEKVTVEEKKVSNEHIKIHLQKFLDECCLLHISNFTSSEEIKESYRIWSLDESKISFIPNISLHSLVYYFKKFFPDLFEADRQYGKRGLRGLALRKKIV